MYGDDDHLKYLKHPNEGTFYQAMIDQKDHQQYCQYLTNSLRA